MSMNYDPDGTPEITPDLHRLARELRMHIVNVVCDVPGAKVGDPEGVSFAALTPHLPRVGEMIELEDGNICEVREVYHKVVSQDFGCITLFANVGAVRVKKRPKKPE
jgi:hypothetical protein